MDKGYYSILRASHLSQIDNFSIEQVVAYGTRLNVATALRAG